MKLAARFRWTSRESQPGRYRTPGSNENRIVHAGKLLSDRHVVATERHSSQGQVKFSGNRRRVATANRL